MEIIRRIARLAMGDREPFPGPVEMKVAAYIPIPKSWGVFERNLALTGRRHPTVKPDYDNIHKMLDGIQPPSPPHRKKNESQIAFEARRAEWAKIKVVILDDKQVVRWQGWKLYSDDPRVVVVVSELHPP